MSAMEVNKFVGAVLVAGLVFMAINVVVDEGLREEPPARTVYPVPKAEKAPAAAAPAAEAPATKRPTLATLLAAADAKRGARLFKKCAACHDAKKGGPNKVGPNLWGIVGRPVASHPGYRYSDALKGHGGKWTFERLFTFLKAPKKVVPGTKMGFPGLKAPEKRADLLAYLRTLSDSPPPLPAP